MNFVFFSEIFLAVTALINKFMTILMTNVMGWVSAIAITLFTVWIIIQGYRTLTGQSREPMLNVVLSMARTAVILIVATTAAFGGSLLQDFILNDVLPEINSIVTTNTDAAGGLTYSTITDKIDANLAYTQVAMAFIEGAQGLNSSQSGANVGNASTATMMAVVGLAGPPMTAGALMLLYQIGLALFIGLGPLFIMCLIFDQTKSLFQGWLMFGLGTMFSLAVLNVMICIVMRITIAVAGALWVTGGLFADTGLNGLGVTNQAMQQGGVGMLMTALLVSAPAMAGRFFSTIVGEFRDRSAFEGAQMGKPDSSAGASGRGQGQGPGPGPGQSASNNTAPRPNHSLPPSYNTRQVNRDVIAGPDKGDSTSNMA